MKIKGRVSVEVIDVVTGIRRWANESNHVTAIGRQIAASLLGSAQNPVTSMRFGTSVTPTTDSMTALVQPVGSTYVLTSEADPVTTDARVLRAYVPTADLNGFTLAEIGLLSSSGNLFSRVVISPVIKTSQVRLIVHWTLSVEVGA